MSEQNLYHVRESEEDGKVALEKVDISDPKKIVREEIKCFGKGSVIDFGVLKDTLALSYKPGEEQAQKQFL